MWKRQQRERRHHLKLEGRSLWGLPRPQCPRLKQRIMETYKIVDGLFEPLMIIIGPLSF